MQADRFKAFFTDFQVQYCNHFSGLDEVFTKKLEYLSELKAKFNETAVRANL